MATGVPIRKEEVDQFMDIANNLFPKIELDPHNLTIDEAIALIAAEVRRAKAKHPGDFANPHHGYAVLLEEVDELWDEIKKNSKTFDILKAKDEAIQVAAMAVRFITEL